MKLEVDQIREEQKLLPEKVHLRPVDLHPQSDLATCKSLSLEERNRRVTILILLLPLPQIPKTRLETQKKKKVEVDLVSSNDESSDTDNEDQDDELAFGKPYPYEKKIVTIPPPFSIIEVDPMKNGKQKIAGGNTTFDLMTSGHWKISGGPLRLNNSEILELRKQIGGDNPLYAIKKFDIETKFFNLVHIDKSPTNKIVEETLKRELSILEACFIFHDRISTHVLAIARQATSQNKKNRKSRKGQYVSEEDELLLRTFFDLISKYRTIKDGKKTK
jgi:hypothetical protein